jgi:hypothetical protein
MNPKKFDDLKRIKMIHRRKHMKKYKLLLMVLILCTLAGKGFSQKKGSGKGKPPGNADTPVTSLINDADTGGTAYRLRSDGLGVYTNVDSVESIIQGIGDWELNTKPSAVRNVSIDLSDPVPVQPAGQTAAPPFNGPLAVPFRFISKCSRFGINLLDLQVNQAVLCPLDLSLDYGGRTYAVRMNENYAGTDFVSWTCLATDGAGQCSSWEMTPSGSYDGESKNIAQLIRIGTKRRDPDELIGQFYLTFRVSLTNP